MVDAAAFGTIKSSLRSIAIWDCRSSKRQAAWAMAVARARAAVKVALLLGKSPENPS
jgi:hypothetical protein